MNRIEAIRTTSKFVHEPHLAIAVDGWPVDELLEELIPGSDIIGSVSSLLGWFHNDADCAIPWQRILPAVGCSGYAPLLICPDDLDLSCNVVMVEVVSEADIISWIRFGIDASPALAAVGSCIRWLPGARPFQFNRIEYERCLDAFRPAK